MKRIIAYVYRQARDALATVVEAMEADGEDLPAPYEEQDGGLHFDVASLKNATPMLIPAEIAGKAVRVNVSLNEGLLTRIDDVARRTGSSRSALLARGAKLIIETEGAT